MIMGGPSFEANVSYKSAENIGRELVNAKHNVLVCDLLKEGLTKYEEVDWEKYSIEILPDKKFINSIENRHVMLENLKKISISDYDIVFNATHGTFGEDGHLSGLMDMLKIKYTGSNQVSSSMAMCKDVAKMLFFYKGINTPNWLAFERGDAGEITTTILKKMPLPLVIKPNTQGSTIGLSIVKEKDKLQEAIELAFQYDTKILVESFVKGRELTVGVLGNEVLPVLEIIAPEKNYDYEAKYVSNETQYVFPDLPEYIIEKLKDYSLKAHEVLGITSYSRIDYIYCEEVQDVFCLEVNTLPGMTGHSLFPKAAKKAGYSLIDIYEKIMELGVVND